MGAPKCRDRDYIDFLVASPKAVNCTEASRVQPPAPDPPAHDAFTRLLHRLEPDPETLWEEAKPLVHRAGGVLVLDDSTLDKPYARKMDLVTRHWSGKHRSVVRGINLLSLLWSDGDRGIPCDYRIYDKAGDGLSKNEHFRALLRAARERGFAPRCVLFDSWYSGLENLKAVRDCGWTFLTRLKDNRLVNPDRRGLRPICQADIAASGTAVWLQGFGLVRVFKIVAPDGGIEYWATNDPDMDEWVRRQYAEWSWAIESYHRGLKQCCGVERAQVRAGRAQRNHIGMAVRAFLRLEHHFYTTGISWYEAKARVVREAVRASLARPLYKLP